METDCTLLYNRGKGANIIEIYIKKKVRFHVGEIHLHVGEIQLYVGDVVTYFEGC